MMLNTHWTGLGTRRFGAVRSQIDKTLKLGRNRHMLKATVYVTKKESVLDPQTNVIQEALQSLDFKQVEQVRVGQTFELTLNTTDQAQAEVLLQEMCEQLLTNP